MIQGKDYANIDGNVLTSEAYAQNSFAIVRASGTWHGRTFTDDHCARDRPLWRAAGKTFGAYMILGWDVHGPSPEEQVAAFIKTYGDRQHGELPVSLDLEADSAKALGRTDVDCLAWAHSAYDALVAHYGIVFIYTSVRVWIDVFGNKPSRMGDSPLWIKIPYPWAVHNVPHPEACPQVVRGNDLPLPWRAPSSPGAWIVQYQGDAKPVPGFSSTVDCNAWLTYSDGVVDSRRPWVSKMTGGTSLVLWQAAHQLQADNKLGPASFAVLTA